MKHLIIASPNSLNSKVISVTLRGSEVCIHCVSLTQCIIDVCERHNISVILFLSLSPYFTSMNIIDEMSRRLDYRPYTYVISHSHSSSIILMLMECGVDQYLTFPLNLYRLRKKVYSQLNAAEQW